MGVIRRITAVAVSMIPAPNHRISFTELLCLVIEYHQIAFTTHSKDLGVGDVLTGYPSRHPPRNGRFLPP
jgi:hypothetical protein